MIRWQDWQPLCGMEYYNRITLIIYKLTIWIKKCKTINIQLTIVVSLVESTLFNLLNLHVASLLMARPVNAILLCTRITNNPTVKHIAII